MCPGIHRQLEGPGGSLWEMIERHEGQGQQGKMRKGEDGRAEARSGPVLEWAAEPTAWWEESRGLWYPAVEAVASSSEPSQPCSLGVSLGSLPGTMVFMI